MKNTFFIPANYLRKKREKRCAGIGADYIPWLKIHEVPSKGRSTRVSGWTTGRIHHMLSDLETKCFYWFDWNLEITDIREQYLLDFQKTVRIARELKYVHPRHTKTHTLHIMTTDFVVNFGPKIVAYSCKYKKDLSSKRTQQKLAIERKYWEEMEIEFRVITEDDIDEVLVRNVRQIHKARDLSHNVPVYPDEILKDALTMNKQLLRDGWTPFEVSCKVDSMWGLAIGTGMLLLKHFLATRKLLIDMSKPFDAETALEVW